MSEDAAIDVVVPARNAEATLRHCLGALRDAGFAPGEVIVADDGSTDGTAETAASFGARVVSSDVAQGAAEARNRAVATGRAPLLLFVDADVAVHAGTRERIAAFFARHPDHAGVIGSYDDAPPAPGRLSRTRNLLHHHVHQGAGGEVASFWTGLGAIRRADFEALGGFEQDHKLEDVALGLALDRAGRKIRLDPDLQCTHLKRWTLRSMVRADLFYRALPWSRMLLDPRGAAPRALNAGRTGQIGVLLAGATVLGIAAAPLAPFALLAAAGAVLALAVLQRDFLALVARRQGRRAAFEAVFVLLVHYLCAGSGFAIALGERLIRRGARPPRA